jgi:hypothetical protein
MPTIMKLAEGNINNFNERVRTLVNELASVDQSVNNKDLLINLMKGYEEAPDKQFVCQMQDKHTRIMYYTDEDRKMEPIMRFAEQFWTDRTNNGTWGKPTHEEQHLIALTAEIRNFRAYGPSSKMDKLTTSNKPTTKKGEKIKKAKSKSNFDPYTTDEAWK